MSVIAIIPCRYGAVRFPGKSLADIHGKPMMWHVYQQTKKVNSIDRVVIATDDERIERAGRDLGLETIMTRGDHFTGTDRVAECAGRLDADILVNVQGDEPMIDPDAIARVVQAIVDCDDPNVQASNGFNEIADPTDAVDSNVVKVITATNGNALAYSRLPVPYPRGLAVTFKRQLGLYAFRKSGLELFSKTAPGPLERAEGVEMLRFVEHGYAVRMVQVANDDAISVDTPADLERVRDLMKRR
jgi:3-deoxy-manno-octulosonate cytidylyltransferase (CMP-KDO synthetase)